MSTLTIEQDPLATDLNLSVDCLSAELIDVRL